MSDSSGSPWIATDDHDDTLPQQERLHIPSQPNNPSSSFRYELSGTGNTILNFTTTASGRPSATVSFSPSPTGVSVSYDTPSVPPGSTARITQCTIDLQRCPQSPLPRADSSSSEHDFFSRASPKRRLSYDELITREQHEDSVTSTLRSRRSGRTFDLAQRRSSFTPDRPANIHTSTSLGISESLGASSSATSVPNTQRYASPMISPPPDFATSVSLRQQQLMVEADTSAASPRTLPPAPPLLPEPRAVNDFEDELRFLRDQWTSVCISLSSLRNMYLAVSSSSPAAAPQEESIAVTAGISSKSSAAQELADFPVPSSISVASFVGMAPPARSSRSSRTQQRRGRRSNRRDRDRASREPTQGERHHEGIHPDVQHEMLIGYDDAMLQIRQLEFKVEALEAEIRRLVEDPSRPL